MNRIESLNQAREILLDAWGKFTYRMSNPIAEILWDAVLHIEKELQSEIDGLTGKGVLD